MYKIIQNNKVVDVVQIPRFVRFLSSGHVAFTDKTSAHGIVGSDNVTIYSFSPTYKNGVTVASIEKITSDEFKRLQSLLNSSGKPSVAELALENAKQTKIKNLSNQCKNKITDGFSIVLSDGIEYSFRLTTEDQLNLMMIENQLNAGVESFIYHATNDACRVFVKEDMLKIIKAFRQHVLYHTTYFNAAKQYIKSLTEIDKVNAFTYGTDIINYIDNTVLKQILKNGGRR